MLASASTILKLHAISEQYLEPVTVYNPKKVVVNSKITNLTWCHDNSYIGLLLEDSFPQIVSCKDRTNIELVHTVQALKKVSAIKFKQCTKRTFALGNCEGEAILYDTKNRNILKKLCELDSPVKSIDFNCNDEQLVVSTGKLVALFVDHDNSNNFLKTACFPDDASCIKFHPATANVLGMAYDNGYVTLKDIENGTDLLTYKTHNAPITGINFSGNHKAVITTGLDKKICVYDYDSRECAFRINVHQAITSSDISMDEICVALGLENGCISVYDIREPLKPLMSTNAHNGPVTKIAFEKARAFLEAPSEKPSCITLNSDVSEQTDDVKALYEVEANPNEKLVQEVMKMFKSYTDYLETKLNDHCAKYQNFITNEFKSIENAMKRWDVLNKGGSLDVGQASNSSESRSIKTIFTRHSSTK